ncbi:MAG: carbohydrate kinase family protein [bacterium]|nr:carbohydrate kinase family protein [bacterium]
MAVVVTGSLAYDHIMVFKDVFRKHILPEKVHMLNVSFAVDDLTVEFGGTAGNIAYSLKLLGLEPLLVATGGKDFLSYWNRLVQMGISTDYIMRLDECYTAQAFITTDLQDNQITAFHGGAAFQAHLQPLSNVKGGPHRVIVSPNGIQAMIEHAQHCREKGWKFWFDPGQAIGAFDGAQLLAAIQGAEGLVLNDYEWSVFLKKTGISRQQILKQLPFLVITLGEGGAEVHAEGHTQCIAAVEGIPVVDPTGAGDAFRAGLLYGLESHMDIYDCCRYGCATASFAVEAKGTQNHRFDKNALEKRFALL